MPVDAEEIGVFSEDVVRLVAAEVVPLVKRNVTAVIFVDRPRGAFAVVAQGLRAWVDELQTARGLDPGVHPCVVRLLNRRGVMPERRGREIGFIGRQPYLQSPGRARQQVANADETADAAVIILAGQIV